MITDTSPLVIEEGNTFVNVTGETLHADVVKEKDRTCFNVYFHGEPREGSAVKMKKYDESSEEAIIEASKKGTEIKDEKTGKSAYISLKGSYAANLKLIDSQALIYRYYGIFFEFARRSNQPLPDGLKISEAQAFFDGDVVQKSGIENSNPCELRILGTCADGAPFSTPTAPHIRKTPHTGNLFKPNHVHDIYSLADEDEGRAHISIIRREIPDHPGIIMGFYDLVGNCNPLLESYLAVANADFCYNFRRTIIDPENLKPDSSSQWMQADISTNQTKAIVQHKPTKDAELFFMEEEYINKAAVRLEEERLKLDDEMADQFDFLISKWAKTAKNYYGTCKVKSNEYLDLRHIKRHKGVHRTESKKAFAERMVALSRLYIKVYKTTITKEIDGKKVRYNIPRDNNPWEFPAIVIEGYKPQESLFKPTEYCDEWLYGPGKLFAVALIGAGRQMALLSAKALEYDPYRQKFEKRLTRYLSYIWRVRQQRENYSQPISVETLLNEIKLCSDSNNPLKTKIRLEKALNTLKDDNILLSWQYKDFDESVVGQRNWTKTWKAALIVIEPPEEVTKFYRDSIQHYDEPIKAIEAPKKPRKKGKKDDK